MKLKPETLKSAKLRKSAMGEDCTIRGPMCNYKPETTVLCHFNFDGGAMGGKSSDLSAGFGCSSCHDWIDRRLKFDGELITDQDYHFYCARSMTRTHQRMWDRGLLKV